MKRLPIKAAEDLGKKYGLSRVLIIAVDPKDDLTYTVSWGDTKENCGYAAVDIQKLRAVLEAQPTSLEDAVAAAKLVRTSNIEGTKKAHKLEDDIKDILDRIPNAVRVREGAGYEDIVASLTTTLIKLGVVDRNR